jgi:hypothetical protein
MQTEIGSIVPGKMADLVGFRLPTKNNLEDFLSCEKADFLMINGSEIDVNW